MHLSTLKHSDIFIAALNGGRDQGEAKGDGEPHKSVTIAPRSRYLTDRRYVERKPLFTEEHQASILKRSQRHPPKLPDKEVSLTQMQLPENPGLSLSDLCLPTDSGEPASSPPSRTSAPELQTQQHHRRCLHSRSAQSGLFSTLLEGQRINPPLRPQLTSTVLHPSYTPRSQNRRISSTHFTSKKGIGVEGTNPGSPGGSSKQKPECSYQADYWACAIPKAQPPCPDRKSTAWNPNTEYEALLDYTYPLRPGHVSSEWNHSDLQADSLLRTNLNMKDSGIDLDHLCSSASVSGMEPSDCRGGFSRDGSSAWADFSSPDLQLFSRCSPDAPPYATPLSFTNPISVSLDSLDCSKERAGGSLRMCGDDCQHRAASSSSSSSAFIRSTSFLPRSRWVAGEMDEEFWPLPEQLEDLQQLSRQVREATAQLSLPLTASCASLDQDATSMLSSVSAPQNLGAEEQTKEAVGDKQDGYEGMQSSTAQTAGFDRDSETWKSGVGARLDQGGGEAGGRLSLTGVRECLLKQLGDSSLEQSDSLMKHIQVFCSQLDLLIQQLYILSQSMEKMAAPAGDIVSVKSLLADYQSFQKEVSSHQPLTSCVLHAGQYLLSCINGTSPYLRDTLLLIERQSGALQSHSDHLFSSILSAMDSLALSTHHSPVPLTEDTLLEPNNSKFVDRP